MKAEFFEGLRCLLEKEALANKQIIEGATAMAEAISKRNTEFLAKQKAAENDIRKGARITGHRLSL